MSKITRDHTSCSCEASEAIFNSNLTSKYKDSCCVGGGFAQWIEYKCKVCGRVWEEDIL